MGRQCTICASRRHAEIEEAIVGGVPYRRIAKTHGVSIAGLSRHLKTHMAEELLENLRERAETLREREMTAFFGPELVQWMRTEDEALAEALAVIEEGLEEYAMEGEDG